MAKLIKYKGRIYRAVDADDKYLEKLKNLLVTWKSVEKQHIASINFARQSLESAIKNPDSYDLKSEFRDRMADLNSMRGSR